MCYVNQILLAK